MPAVARFPSLSHGASSDHPHQSTLTVPPGTQPALSPVSLVMGLESSDPALLFDNKEVADYNAIRAVMAADLHKQLNVVIVSGTSLKIPGVKWFIREMCGVVRKAA